MDNTEKGVIVRLTNQGLRLEPVGQTSWKDVDSLVGAASKQITSTRIEKLEEVVKSQGRVIEQLVNTLKKAFSPPKTDGPDSAEDLVSNIKE